MNEGQPERITPFYWPFFMCEMAGMHEGLMLFNQRKSGVKVDINRKSFQSEALSHFDSCLS